MGKVAIVVPTIREGSIKRFIDEWHDLFFKSRHSVILLIIEDNDKKTFNIKSHDKILHYCWSDIENDLRENSWIIPRRTDCVRSYGYYKAYMLKADIVITLDDDCYPDKSHQSLVETHFNILTKQDSRSYNKWCWTVNSLRTRGIPYENLTVKTDELEVFLNHGLWNNVLDFDAKTQLSLTKSTGWICDGIDQIIETGKYFPMCGMNLAWRREVTPLMYFLLMGQDNKGNLWGYDRFGDIWAGVISKKILDHLGYCVHSGSPYIWHDRASDPYKNLEKEKEGLAHNEDFWKMVDSIKLTKNDLRKCYLELAEKISYKSDYWNKCKQAMKIWISLF